MVINVYLNNYFNGLIEKAKKENDIDLLQSIRKVIQNTPISYFENTLQDTRQYANDISDFLRTIGG